MRGLPYPERFYGEKRAGEGTALCINPLGHGRGKRAEGNIYDNR